MTICIRSTIWVNLFQKPIIVKYFSDVSGWKALFDGDKQAVKYFILLISGWFTQ